MKHITHSSQQRFPGRNIEAEPRYFHQANDLGLPPKDTILEPVMVLPGGRLYDTENAALTINGEIRPLNQYENLALRTLVQRRGQIISQDYLIHQLWNGRGDVDPRILKVHVSNLRKKLRLNLNDSTEQSLIIARWGQGYCFSTTSQET